MTDRIALILGLIVAAAIAVDLVLFGGSNMVFLGRKMFAFLDWLAFWR